MYRLNLQTLARISTKNLRDHRAEDEVSDKKFV